MCGRYVMTLPHEAMARLFEAAPGNDLPPVPNWNVCPTQQVASVRSGDGSRHLVSMRWGFVPHWSRALNDGPLIINARAETLAGKPAFRAAARERRCLIPATGYYEWTKDAEGNRLPWYIHPADDAPLAFAGLWQGWGDDDAPTCAIVTTAANTEMGRIHHRMPLALPPEDWPLWLGEAGPGAARLMVPAPEGRLTMHRVGRAVNSSRASGADLVRPIGDSDAA